MIYQKSKDKLLSPNNEQSITKIAEKQEYQFSSQESYEKLQTFDLLDTVSDDINQNTKKFDNLINFIEERILKTDDVLKLNSHHEKQIDLKLKANQMEKNTTMRKNNHSKETNDILFKKKKSNYIFEKQDNSFNKLSKISKIKINLNRSDCYTEMFRKMKSLHCSSSVEAKQKSNCMLEILKLKKKNTLEEVKSLEKEILLLEKEKKNEISVEKNKYSQQKIMLNFFLQQFFLIFFCVIRKLEKDYKKKTPANEFRNFPHKVFFRLNSIKNKIC